MDSYRAVASCWPLMEFCIAESLIILVMIPPVIALPFREAQY
jgi:hypothetical protein